MYKFLIALTVFMLAPVLSSSAQDDSIDVVPGNYSVTTETKSSFNENVEKSTDDECMADTKVGVSDFLPDDNACTATNIKKSGNKISFDMKCSSAQGMPAMTGTAEISATKSTVKSHYKMAGNFQGVDFSVDSKSQGKLTGPCK